MSLTARDEFDALTADRRPNDAPYHSDRSEPGSDDDAAQHHRVSDDDDDDDDSDTPSRPTAMPAAVYTVPSTAFAANTGPKGVIADAQSFEKARKRTFRQTLYAFSSGIGLAADPPRPKPARSSSREKSSGSDGSDGSEDEFMRTWRQNRMDEMQRQGQDVRTRRQSPSKRRYGHVGVVGPIGYLDAIEKVAPDTVVVVLINDDRSAVSGLVEDALATLARKHAFTRFVKMSYEDAEMDPVTVPAILAYRAGDLIANIVSVIDEIPAGRHMSSSSIESLLQERKVLD